MGMSASQARLLSITGRITDNELKAQFITNAKLRLSAESTEAANAYTNALDAEQLVFMGYDNNGAQTKISLTPALLYEYEPLKNQYILLNSSNQMLVGHTEAQNYEKSDSLSDFLRKYNLLEDVTITTQTEVPNPDWDIWFEKHEEWKLREPKESDPKYQTVIKPGETIFTHTDSAVYDAIANISCFSITQGGARCYMHVLSALLGFGEFTTSNGNTFKVFSVEEIEKYAQDNNIENQSIEYNGYTFSEYGWGWNSCTTDEASHMDGLRDELKNDPVSDQAYNGNLKTEAHETVPVLGDGSDAQKYNDPQKMAEGKGGCWQKCIDLLWDLHWNYDGSSTGGAASNEELGKFWYFVEMDLGEGTITKTEDVTEFDKENFDKDYEEWLLEEEPEVPKTKTETDTETFIVVNDKDKAQWYTNLWYKMNGSDSANLVRIDEEASEKYPELKGKTVFSLEAAQKAEESFSYVEYESNLYNSAEWLQFALEHGVVTMEKASFFDPAEDNGRNLELTDDGIYWKSVIYTNAPDIASIDNEKAISIAQAEYNKKKNEIQAKDKKYDADLRKLDTEHNALQTEYESLKTIIEKNVDRSFKAFS